jgi:hypothetical protein
MQNTQKDEIFQYTRDKNCWGIINIVIESYNVIHDFDYWLKLLKDLIK